MIVSFAKRAVWKIVRRSTLSSDFCSGQCSSRWCAPIRNPEIWTHVAWWTPPSDILNRCLSFLSRSFYWVGKKRKEKRYYSCIPIVLRETRSFTAMDIIVRTIITAIMVIRRSFRHRNRLLTKKHRKMYKKYHAWVMTTPTATGVRVTRSTSSV